jgi:hypothetical protein
MLVGLDKSARRETVLNGSLDAPGIGFPGTTGSAENKGTRCGPHLGAGRPRSHLGREAPDVIKIITWSTSDRN